MVFYAAFNSMSVISRRQLTLFMLSWVSPVLGWALKCIAQGHSHEKNPEDLVRLEPRTPGLRVKHLTTEPRGTLQQIKNCLQQTVFVWKSLKFVVWLTLSSIYTHFNTMNKKALGKQCEKKGGIEFEQFHLFPHCFLSNLYLKILK